MEVSVDSMIEKPFCSGNYDEKLEIAKAQVDTKIKYIKSQIRLLEKVLHVGSRICIKLSSTSTHLFNKWLHAAANIVEEHTSKKCSPYATGRPIACILHFYLLCCSFSCFTSECVWV